MSNHDAPHDWREMTVPTFAGKYDSNISVGGNYRSLKMGELVGLSPTSKPKANAPAFIPSAYSDFDARDHTIQREKGQFVALTGDIDKGNVPMGDLIAYSRELFGSEVAVFIYSTGSAKSDDKRWRVIVPLHKTVPFARWNEAQEAFFSYMEAQGVSMDWSLARSAQPVYLPNVPPDRRDENGVPLFYESYMAGEEGVSL